MNTFQICMALLATFVLSASCFPVESEREKRQAKETATGALGGAALGALIGHFGKRLNPNFDAKKGAAAGALLGGGAGFLSGRNKNKAVTDSSVSISDDGTQTTKGGFFSSLG